MKKKILEKQLLLALCIGGVLTFPALQAEASGITTVYGKYITSDTTIDTASVNNITATTENGNNMLSQAAGVYNFAHTVTLTGAKDLSITAAATGGEANTIGIFNYGRTTVEGNSTITVTAGGNANASAIGIYNSTGGTSVDGNVKIIAIATATRTGAGRSANVDGIGIRNTGGTTSVGGNVEIIATAVTAATIANSNGVVYGIEAGAGTVTLYKNVTITAKTSAADAVADSLYTNGGTININQDKAYTVKLIGDVLDDTDGIINLNLTNNSSFLQGNVINNGGTINFTLANGAVWQPVYNNTNGTITYANDNSLSGYSTTQNTINAITLSGGIIDLTWDNAARSTARTLYIGRLKGTGGTVKINTDLANDKGDNIAIGTATSDSTLGIGVNYDPILSAITSPTIITANDGGYAVAAVTTDSSNIVLTGVAEEYEAYKVTPIFSGTSITGLSVGVSSNTKGAASAGLRDGEMIQVSMNHLRKRMGELRNDGDGENGIWARTYGGEISNDKYGYNESRYNGVQIGYDKKQEGPSGKKYTGGAISYTMSNDSFATGSGNSYDTDLALYQTWIANNGHYSDIIVKHGFLENKYGMTDISSNYSSADYHTQTNSISGEYGYRKPLGNHWFAEPQMELTYGHIDSADYTTSSGMKVQQDGIDRLIGRVGIGLGKTLDNGNHIYTSLSALHEFKGEESIKASSLNYSEDMSGTWGEFIIGMDAKLGNHSTGYLNVEKLFSGDVSSNWQFNAGCRFMF